MSLLPVVELCERAAAGGTFPGCAFAVGDPSGFEVRTVGRVRYWPDAPLVTEETVYDLASLTKVMATTTAAMILFDQGLLDLDQPVTEIVPEFRGEGKEDVSVKHLLLHNSGLPLSLPYQEVLSPSAEARNVVLSAPLQKKPGSETVYICLGFVVLQSVIERISVESLDAFIFKNLFEPAGLTSLTFRPLHRELCAPTETTPDWRKSWWPNPDENDHDEFIQGRVHDPMAFMLGGVSGNAGLFGHVRDVAEFARMMLNRGEMNGRQLIRPSTVESWTMRQSVESTRALGWDTKAEVVASAGSLMHATAYGHTGYTGTSIWIDPEAEMFAVLLSNRVHPTSENTKLLDFRGVFHDCVMHVVCGA
ncbi:MAG: serine hydrolase [Fimbriimonadaceae bacterium]|nr:serine hydrolase [Fimbriimonadaceae bacterium]